MKNSEIKRIVTKSPRAIIKSVVGNVSDAFISRVLNDKTSNNETVGARLVTRVAHDLAEEIQAIETKLKEKYRI